MKKVKDYKFLPIILSSIESIKINGSIFYNPRYDGWSKNYTVLDSECKNHINIDEHTFMESYVVKLKNEGKILILSNKERARDIITDRHYIKCPMNDHRKFKNKSHQYLSFDDIIEYNNLFYANFVTESFTREKQYDDIIFDRSDFLKINKDFDCPNSIKRYYLDKNERNKFLISLNKIKFDSNIFRSEFNYNKYLNVIIEDDKDELIQKLFYCSLSNSYKTKYPIEIYSVNDNKIIKNILD